MWKRNERIGCEGGEERGRKGNTTGIGWRTGLRLVRGALVCNGDGGTGLEIWPGNQEHQAKTLDHHQKVPPEWLASSIYLQLDHRRLHLLLLSSDHHPLSHLTASLSLCLVLPLPPPLVFTPLPSSSTTSGAPAQAFTYHRDQYIIIALPPRTIGVRYIVVPRLCTEYMPQHPQRSSPRALTPPPPPCVAGPPSQLRSARPVHC